MAKRVPTTKAGKAEKRGKVLREFKRGTLRSGSKTGPKVTSRDQAIAIALSESGESRANTKGKRKPARQASRQSAQSRNKAKKA